MRLGQGTWTFVFCQGGGERFVGPPTVLSLFQRHEPDDQGGEYGPQVRVGHRTPDQRRAPPRGGGAGAGGRGPTRHGPGAPSTVSPQERRCRARRQSGGRKIVEPGA